MDISTHIFLLIVVGGVTSMWSFRLFAGSKRQMYEIEYLCFACIWGTALVVIHAELMKHNNFEVVSRLVNNPLASAMFFSTLGLLVGSVLGYLDKQYKVTVKVGKLIARL